ncbi:MAG: GNAT family N-acetyltransferase [Clostridiales bacterium]|nr:GNAT family N-acetyltransferase [Clostridiales bacterium]
MIRKQTPGDRDQIARIWLDTNLKAHDFVPAAYWKGNFEAVREMLSQAEIYLYEAEAEGGILGFMGLDGDYIAGIFVSETAQSKGIGSQLIQFAKSIRNQLELRVYVKNTGAIRFYERAGFQISHEGTDEATGEKEYFMVWKQS